MIGQKIQMGACSKKPNEVDGTGNYYTTVKESYIYTDKYHKLNIFLYFIYTHAARLALIIYFYKLVFFGFSWGDLKLYWQRKKKKKKSVVFSL